MVTQVYLISANINCWLPEHLQLKISSNYDQTCVYLDDLTQALDMKRVLDQWGYQCYRQVLSMFDKVLLKTSNE